jgi:hypothetical protein
VEKKAGKDGIKDAQKANKKVFYCSFDMIGTEDRS